MSETPTERLVDLKKIRRAWFLPRLDWDVIDNWIRRHVPEADRPRAWGEVVEQWLDRLNRALGGGYRVVAARELWLFTSEPDEDAGRRVLAFAQTALDTIRDLIGELAAAPWRGPLPLLRFEDQRTYYDYLSQFYEEGEHGGSAGCCCQKGYVHIALVAPGGITPLEVLAHELTHACLFHLQLPMWLEEGVTQHMESGVNSWGRTTMTPESLVELRRFWKKEGLSDFWWGQGFFCPDEGQRHSYQLAQLLFQLLLTDHPRTYRRFLAEARRPDAGEAAARSALGMGLEDLVATFLGPGDWKPRPPDAMAWCERAAFHFEAGRHEAALADVEQALALNPSLASAHTRLGEIRLIRGEFNQAVSSFEKAVEFAPRDRDACNRLAWLRATAGDDALRDGPRALELATQACTLTGYDSSPELDTLAAAHAELGQFEEAIHWQKEALRLAPAEEKEDYRSRLLLYRGGQPFRDRDGLGCRRNPSSRSKDVPRA